MKLFTGCRTRADAEARFRAFLEQHFADAERKLVTDLLANDDGRLDDVDASIGGALEICRETRADGIEAAMAQFRSFCDEAGLPQ